MATTTNSGTTRPATKAKRPTRTTPRKSATSAPKTTTSARKTTTSGRKPAPTARRSAAASRPNTRPTASSASIPPKTRVEQAQVLARRSVLVPVGASLVAQDTLVSTVKGIATKYRTRSAVEREFNRYERRGAGARNRFERQVRRTRTNFERELRQRRSRVERLVSDASGRIGSIS